MKTVFKVLIGVAALALVYLCARSIATPVEFDKLQNKREVAIKKRLKEIASYEVAYKTVHNKFATSEELINFLENGQLYYVNADGDYTDEMRDKGISEQEAAAKGLIKRDTVRVSVKDSLLRGKEYSSASDILKVPGFEANNIGINTNIIDQYIGNDTVHISVFEAFVPMDVYLSDLDGQILKEKVDAAKKLNDGKGYPGLKIGSLDELKLTGNWE